MWWSEKDGERYFGNSELRNLELSCSLYISECWAWFVFVRLTSDDDGSEELDFTEFSLAVQTECNLGTDDIPQDDMAELFAAVDMDMSGGIDATEELRCLEDSTLKKLRVSDDHRRV